RLATTRISPAVPAGVARPGSYHPPAALGALDGVFPVVEQGGLARRGGLGRTSLRSGLLLAAGVRRGQSRPHLRREDADLLLLLHVQELLAHPPEHVVGDRLRDPDVGVV